MTTRRALASVVGAVAVAALLVGCSYVNRVAARLNPDGSVDFATCDERNVDSLEVSWYYKVAGNEYEARDVTVTPVEGAVREGDVFHLDATAPHDEGWEWVSIGAGRNNAGLYLHGTFRPEDLASGDWVWNQTGIFIGSVDVEHCDLDEANAR